MTNNEDGSTNEWLVEVQGWGVNKWVGRRPNQTIVCVRHNHPQGGGVIWIDYWSPEIISKAALDPCWVCGAVCDDLTRLKLIAYARACV